MAAKTIAVTLVVALAARPLAAYPEKVGCGKSITSGSMMGATISTNGASEQVQLAKGGVKIACGGSLTAGDTGLTLVKGSTGSQYRECIHTCVVQHMRPPRRSALARLTGQAHDDWHVFPVRCSSGSDRGGNVSGQGFVGHHLRQLRDAKDRKQVYEMVACGRVSACVSFACVAEAPRTVRHRDAIRDSYACCWFVAADPRYRLAATPIPSPCHRRAPSPCG
jgi:hypothetical protein